MKYFLSISCLLWLLGFTINISWAYKGLYIMNHGTRSHLSFHKAILETLSERGHKITFVSPFDTKYNIKNVTEILLKENWTEKLVGNPFNNSNDLSMLFNFFEYGPKSCTGPLGDPAMIKALQEDYDYVIISIFLAECFLTVPYVKKIPFIYVFQNIVVGSYAERTGSIEFSAINPFRMNGMSFPYSFWERVYYVSIDVGFRMLINHMVTLTYLQAKEEDLWPSDVPDIHELLKQPAFAIVNSVRALEYPVRPMSPSAIYVGGLHIKEPQPLKQELAEWLDGSGTEGFIYFSLGTVIKAEHLKQEHLTSILEVFGSLKQRILWKWDSEVKDLPSNVKISSWLPQQDILAHPKIRLFISHGGLFGSQEAMYFEVPVLGMPIFLDQYQNIGEIVSQGWGRSLAWEELTKDNFRESIQDILTNNSYREKAHERSVLMRDWPRTPKEEVGFWVEYVVRHNGATHLHPPFTQMHWYQIYNMDVWLFISAFCFGLLTTFTLCLKFIYKFIKKRLFKMFKIKTE